MAANDVTLTRQQMSTLVYACQCLVDERRRNNRDYMDVLDLKGLLTDALKDVSRKVKEY